MPNFPSRVEQIYSIFSEKLKAVGLARAVPSRMSYAPRTKLSCDSSSCTVLNDDYVFVSSGLAANQRMPFADWRIIIGDETVREEFLPLCPAQPEAEPEPQPVATAEPEPAPLGTKWRWAADDTNYRVAIQTKYGVLQVKQSSESPSFCHLVDFKHHNSATYEAWVATLPAWPSGTITKTLPQHILSELERRKKRSAELLSEGGSASAIEAIQKLWKVQTSIFRRQSTIERISYTEDIIGRIRGELNRITIEQDMTTPKVRRRLTRQLEKFVSSLTQLKACAALKTPEQNNFHETYMADYSKQRLYIQTSIGKLPIAYDRQTQSVAVRVPGEAKLTFVKTLEDLPFSIGMRLRLSVVYRRKEIDLCA
jgi:hypothetical protein